MTTKNITLDAWRDNYVHVHAVKGETAARFLAVTLTGNGAAINLSDKTVAIYYKKPDGTTIFNSGTIKTATAGLVEIPLTAQMSVLAGEMQDVEIRVTGTGGGTLKIKGLSITIDPAESYDTAVASTDEYTALSAALADTSLMTEHMMNGSNPHGVTAAQVGLDKTAIENHLASVSNPHSVTAAQLGIGVYIISTGTDNGWQYVKYSNNTFTAWYSDGNVSAVNTKNQACGMYFSDYNAISCPSFMQTMSSYSITGSIVALYSGATGYFNNSDNKIYYSFWANGDVWDTGGIRMQLWGTY